MNEMKRRGFLASILVAPVVRPDKADKAIQAYDEVVYATSGAPNFIRLDREILTVTSMDLARPWPHITVERGK